LIQVWKSGYDNFRFARETVGATITSEIHPVGYYDTLVGMSRKWSPMVDTACFTKLLADYRRDEQVNCFSFISFRVLKIFLNFHFLPCWNPMMMKLTHTPNTEWITHMFQTVRTTILFQGGSATLISFNLMGASDVGQFEQRMQ
jgi:hypothetical protein